MQDETWIINCIYEVAYQTSHKIHKYKKWIQIQIMVPKIIIWSEINTHLSYVSKKLQSSFKSWRLRGFLLKEWFSKNEHSIKMICSIYIPNENQLNIWNWGEMLCFVSWKD